MEWADLRQLVCPPRTLADRIIKAIEYFPCDILFLHRDAENQPPDYRRREIEAALAEVHQSGRELPFICVVPVRMQEAWFLFNEHAIRKAAGNPRSTVRLVLPRLSSMERSPDPKKILYSILKTASELRGRRLKKFKPAKCVILVAENIADYSPLRRLSAFNRLEADIQVLRNSGILLRNT